MDSFAAFYFFKLIPIDREASSTHGLFPLSSVTGWVISGSAEANYFVVSPTACKLYPTFIFVDSIEINITLFGFITTIGDLKREERKMPRPDLSVWESMTTESMKSAFSWYYRVTDA